jgi:phosphate:Na+ symporter
VAFSDVGMTEISEMADKARKFLAFVLSAMERGDSTILEKAHHMEETIDELEETLRNNHITRLNTGECAVLPGLIYIDMLHNFEKIGDHTFNVAEAVVGRK